MLATLAEFPHPGSFAWTRPTKTEPGGERVRILEVEFTLEPLEQRALIAYTGLPPRDPALRRIGAFSMPASGNTRLPLSNLAATRDEALLVPSRHGEVAARSADGGGRQPAPRKSRQPRRSAR